MKGQIARGGGGVGSAKSATVQTVIVGNPTKRQVDKNIRQFQKSAAPSTSSAANANSTGPTPDNTSTKLQYNQQQLRNANEKHYLNPTSFNNAGATDDYNTDETKESRVGGSQIGFTGFPAGGNNTQDSRFLPIVPSSGNLSGLAGLGSKSQGLGQHQGENADGGTEMLVEGRKRHGVGGSREEYFQQGEDFDEAIEDGGAGDNNANEDSASATASPTLSELSHISDAPGQFDDGSDDHHHQKNVSRQSDPTVTRLDGGGLVADSEARETRVWKQGHVLDLERYLPRHAGPSLSWLVSVALFCIVLLLARTSRWCAT